MKTLNYLTTVIVTILITSSVSQAQFAVGAKVGMNFSTQSELGQIYDNSDFKTDAQTGLQLEYRFHPVLSVQLEGNYISKGTKIIPQENISSDDVIRNMEYINIPLLVKARFSSELGLKENHRVFFYGGPYYSTLISATDRLKIGDDNETIDIDDNTEISDMGITFGGGLSYILKNKNELFLDLRYDMGLSEVISTDKDLRNKTIGLSFGYRFL